MTTTITLSQHIAVVISITDSSPVVQVITGLFPFLPITLRLILKIGKPIKNQVKGTVRMQSLLSSEID